jgi:hypothetical protein
LKTTVSAPTATIATGENDEHFERDLFLLGVFDKVDASKSLAIGLAF